MTHHIKALLYQHDCVVIPAFGAFLVQYQSAKIDMESHCWSPPKRVLRFNAQLKSNDGLLQDYLQQEEGLDYVQAQLLIQEFVEDITTSLQLQQKLSLASLGSFTMQQDQLVFDPFDTNFLSSAFGLSSTHASPISRTAEEVTKEEDTTDVVALASSPRKAFPYAKYAAVGIIALGIAGFAGFSWYSQQVQAHNQLVESKVQKTIENKLQTANFSIAEPLPSLQINLKKTLPSKHIHIVGGAFREEANAQKKLVQLQQAGFDAQLIGKNRYGLYQVSYASFYDLKEAKQKLREIKKAEMSSAWLLVE